jgi:hypothetical protein
MTDFCISAVRYDSDNQHIEFVRVREDKGTKVGPTRIVPREFVADLIRLEKATFQTIVYDKGTEKYKNGALVHVIDETFLSTDKNDITKDNLGELPKF